MPAPTLPRRQFSPLPRSTLYPGDMPMMDAKPLGFDDNNFVHQDSDQMLFDFDDVSFHEHSSVQFPWDLHDIDMDSKPVFDMHTSPRFGFQHPPTDNIFDSTGFFAPEALDNSPSFDNNLYLSNWVHDTDLPSPSSPISIPASTPSPPYIPFAERSPYAADKAYSPANFAALHHLPPSASPASSFEDIHSFERSRVDSISPKEVSAMTPAWASQLWDAPRPGHIRTSSSRSPVRHSPLSPTNTQRLRIPRRDTVSPVNLFQSASAPALTLAPGMARAYSSGKAESGGVADRDATIRRKRKTSDPEEIENRPKDSDSPPLKSVLRPPKLAPSAWQLYFTDWIQRQQASNTRKLNVAQAAKEAGQEYAGLSAEEKEPYKRRSQGMKEARERELAAYMRTLTPDDIKRENAYRAAQRKAGKSRKSNIKDPNAPKKPLSAYFMFLQRIRANPHLVQEIFGDETETTKQSVLAAAKWRSMTDDERKPFLAQAEQEKMEYEAARRLYEEGAPAFGTTINFSILPGSPAFRSVKVESESESEGYTDDGGYERYTR
ncbi:putative HMG1 protein [Armillaria borealis]|uniref:HMG1 protein n=1 Tax=Armillaria borealis TaxID=47425 RepID=A0AA39K5R1_9AGAR|nr:putative HMG1 protein [Armillaria borealis]